MSRHKQFRQLKPEDRLGDAPIEAKHHENMVAIAQSLDTILNGQATGADRKVGFVLLIFPFDEKGTGRCNYISNGANREDVVTLMKEMIARFEGQPELKGTA